MSTMSVPSTTATATNSNSLPYYYPSNSSVSTSPNTYQQPMQQPQPQSQSQSQSLLFPQPFQAQLPSIYFTQLQDINLALASPAQNASAFSQPFPFDYAPYQQQQQIQQTQQGQVQAQAQAQMYQHSYQPQYQHQSQYQQPILYQSSPTLPNLSSDNIDYSSLVSYTISPSLKEKEEHHPKVYQQILHQHQLNHIHVQFVQKCFKNHII